MTEPHDCRFPEVWIGSQSVWHAQHHHPYPSIEQRRSYRISPHGAQCSTPFCFRPGHFATLSRRQHSGSTCRCFAKQCCWFKGQHPLNIECGKAPRYSVLATPFASSQDRTSRYTSPVVSHIPQTKLLPDSEARPSLICHRKIVNLAVPPCCLLTRTAAGASTALASRSWKHRKVRTKD
jgi:hypothetical protein